MTGKNRDYIVYVSVMVCVICTLVGMFNPLLF
jgi:hypothetical protein